MTSATINDYVKSYDNLVDPLIKALKVKKSKAHLVG